MPTETKDVVQEEKAAEINSDSSVEEILKHSPDAQQEAEKPAESSPEDKPIEEVAEEVSEDVKTPETETVEKEDSSPIPYPRFKEVNDAKNEISSELDKTKESLEEANVLLKDPEVLRLVRQKQGFSGEAIDAELKDLGYQPKPKTEVIVDKAKYDLSKPDGWSDYIEAVAEAKADKKFNLLKDDLSKVQNNEKQRQVNNWIKSQEAEAKKLAKETYKIEYGEAGKTEKDSNTAVGKIARYLQAHPEDAGLGHVKVLKLAIADEGFKLGEQKGVVKEKQRQEKLKSAAMEGEAQTSKEETPQSDWSIDKILKWREKHPDYEL